jgi:hypothetical protein
MESFAHFLFEPAVFWPTIIVLGVLYVFFGTAPIWHRPKVNKTKENP